ncbi:hypothetical protein D3C86_1395620 [compost metagenome]
MGDERWVYGGLHEAHDRLARLNQVEPAGARAQATDLRQGFILDDRIQRAVRCSHRNRLRNIGALGQLKVRFRGAHVQMLHDVPWALAAVQATSQAGPRP